MSEAASFDGLAAGFLEYGEERTRGAVRYALAQENLEPFVDLPHSQTALDICSGSGIDAAWLATRGLGVTLVEPSSEQLAIARDRFRALPYAIGRLITPPLCSDFMDYQTERLFDVVLMHGVAMYQQNPDQYFKKAMSHVKPGGYLSILEKGWGAAAQRVLDTKDLKAMRHFEETGKFVNRRGREVSSFNVPELQEKIETFGGKVVKVSGVRIVSDNINEKLSDYGSEAFQKLLDIEREASQDPSLVGMAQMIHLIAQKPD